MKRALLALMLVALPAAAQNSPQKAPEPAPKERRPLNLRLDNPSSFATVAPPEKEEPKGLPTLGGDARKVEAPRTAGTKSEGGPFPKDTNPNN